MDLTDFDNLATTAAELHVLGVNGEPLTYENGAGDLKPITISLVSQDSAEYQRVFKKQVTENTKRLTSRAAVTTGDALQEDRIDLLVACTRGWEGFTDQGKPYEFSRKNAAALYKRLAFIKEQVDAFIHSRGNFLASN
jgi:hypothetical protein